MDSQIKEDHTQCPVCGREMKGGTLWEKEKPLPGAEGSGGEIVRGSTFKEITLIIVSSIIAAFISLLINHYFL